MKITEITFSEGKTIQEASYEPRSFHFSAKAESDGTDKNIQDAYDKLKLQVHTALEREILKWRNPQKFVRERLKETDVPFKS